MKLMPLKQAKDEGLARYFTGCPCKKGHIAERLTSSRACVVCTREKLAKYRIENRTNLLEKKRIAQKIYAQQNPEKIAETRKATVEKHRKARNEEKAAWRRRNSGKVLALTRKRQLSKIQHTPSWLTEDDFWIMSQAYELAALRTKMFGFAWHVDHVLPLQGDVVSGLHVPTNLQVIPGYENSRKGNRVELA